MTMELMNCKERLCIQFIVNFLYCSCWISFDKDVVWGFVGPMLLIIVVISHAYINYSNRAVIHTYTHIHTYIMYILFRSTPSF